MLEIERKFLVNSNAFLKLYYSKHEIAQGYLSSVPERTVRIRIRDNQSFITIKGKNSENGLSRFEWEKEIEKNEAEQLLLLCEKGVINKTRYNVRNENHIIEVDVFAGENEGLIVAEIELKSENESFNKPIWLGEEVTNIEQYYNSYLIKKPFKSW